MTCTRITALRLITIDQRPELSRRVMPWSDSDSDDSSSNVIYIKNNRKKKETTFTPRHAQMPEANFTQQQHTYQANPFFNPMFSIGHRNFQ